MRRLACLMAFAFAGWLLSAPALGETTENTWQWRGPGRDGISTEKGLLRAWPENGPPLLWKSSGLGSGFSSVAVVGDRIYTLGKRDGKVRLFCVSTEGGKELWSSEVGEGDNPNCTPAVDGDLVYGVSHSGDLVCFQTANGQEVWRKNFGRDFKGRMMSSWGYSETPLIDGKLLICTPGGDEAMLAALDKRTGAVVWTTKMPPKAGNKGQDGAGYASVVISNAAGVKQYVTLVGRGVIGVDAQTGNLLWGYNTVANGTANIPSPIVKGDFVFCSSGYGDGGSALLKVTRQGNQLKTEEVYFLPPNELQNHHGGMILLGENLFLGHGHNKGFPTCVKFASGEKVWSPGRGPGEGSAAITYADGHLYFRYENGVMALIEASPSEYKVKGTFKTAVVNGSSWPHPAIAGGKLYLRDQNDLMCYDIRAK